MKRLSLIVLLLAAACDQRTSVLIEMNGPQALDTLNLTVARPDRTINRTLTESKPLALPASVLVLLPDLAEKIDLTVSGTDSAGEVVGAHTSIQSQPHHETRVTFTLSVGGNDFASLGDLAGADLEIPDGADLSSADLTGFVAPDGGGDMGSSVPSLSILTGLPGDNATTWDGVGTDARISVPGQCVLVGTSLYFFELYGCSSMRKVDVTNGTVTTVPLIDDTNGMPYCESGAYGLAYDAATSTFYFGNYFDHTILKVAMSDLHVKLMLGAIGSAGSTDSPPRFHNPTGLALDGHGNLFVADTSNHALRQISLAGPTVTTIAGDPAVNATDDGLGSAGHFKDPSGVAYDPSGALYITDDYTLRKATVSASPSPAAVSTLIPTGANNWADDPVGIVNAGGGVLYVLDQQRNTLQKVTISGASGSPMVVAGHDQYDGVSFDGVGLAAYFTGPRWLTLDGAGSAYITEAGAVRKVTLSNYNVTTLAGLSPHAGDNDTPAAGDITGLPARLDSPAGLAFDGVDTIYFADASNNVIRTVRLSTGVTATYAGNGTSHSVDGNLATASFGGPTGLARDSDGTLYVTDYSSHTVRKIAVNGDVSTIAGVDNVPGAPSASPSPSPGTTVHFYNPDSLALDGDHTLFVSDANNNVVREIDLSTAQYRVTTIGTGVAGTNNGSATTATFQSPHGLAFDKTKQLLYVADYDADLIRTIDLSNRAAPMVGTLVGVVYSQTHADGPFGATRFYAPLGLALDDNNTVLWVADNSNQCIRKLDLVGKTSSTPIGTVPVPITKASALPGFVHTPWTILPTPRGLVITSYEENTILLATGL